MKFVFITGGVVSGLGKGITAASLSLLLKSRGYKVAPVKVDMYLNIDAGTIRPLEHGENFVTKDGLETDEDIGHYERFLHQDLLRVNYITTGQIYQEVLRAERALEYEGEDVEAIPHLTDEITRRIKAAGKAIDADIVVTEFGGTITLQEIQNRIFVEASRIMKLRNPEDVVQIHVTYLPLVKTLGELKSKPAQTSVYILNSMGIQPEIVVARSERLIDQRRLDRLAVFTNTRPECIFSVPDVESVYEVPLILSNDYVHLDELVLKYLELPVKEHQQIEQWKTMVEKFKNGQKREVTIAMVTKYFKSGDYDLADSYVSVLEAIKHASTELGIKVNLKWVNSDGLERSDESGLHFAKLFEGIDGMIVPQGWGSRGVEGKIRAVQFARENKIPYLGLCFGMQMAVIEFARNVCGMKGANSQEVDQKTKFPVIHVMPDQKKYLAKRQYGGTIRLGQWPTKIKNEKGKLRDLYEKYKEFAKEYIKDLVVMERHRHRYEVNNKFRKRLEKAGMRFSGVSPDGKLVEAIELPDHPFFVGTQFHPELQSRPLTPHPLFLGFMESVIKQRKRRQDGIKKGE